MKCRPEKVKEAIEYFKIAYEIFPDIVSLNQIAIAHEMIGETKHANDYFNRMKSQAESENNEVYLAAAEAGVQRCK